MVGNIQSSAVTAAENLPSGSNISNICDEASWPPILQTSAPHIDPIGEQTPEGAPHNLLIHQLVSSRSPQLHGTIAIFWADWKSDASGEQRATAT
jgi:hypothetical protein